MFDANLGGKIDVSKINRPIQLIAVFIIVIAIAFLIIGYYLSATQLILSYICIGSAIFFTAAILAIFLIILLKIPWAFYHPTDFQPGEYFQFVKHWIEFQEEITPEFTDQKNRASEPTLKDQSSPIKVIDDKPMFQNYLIEALTFEIKVKECLDEIDISYQSTTNLPNDADFYVQNKNGNIVPIEVKTSRRPNARVITRINEQIKRNLRDPAINEFILIFSQKLEEQDISRIEAGISPNQLHLIFENDKEKLKEKLKQILK